MSYLRTILQLKDDPVQGEYIEGLYVGGTESVSGHLINLGWMLTFPPIGSLPYTQ